MTLNEAFPITPEERARLDAAPFLGTDEDGWSAFAGMIHEQVLIGYAAGEMELRRVFEVMRSCSLHCRLNDRITWLALTVERALPITPKKRKRLQNPEWLKKSAASLVSMLREDRPGEPWAPNEGNEWTTAILNDAIAWLVTLGLCEPKIDPRTLYRWCRAHKAWEMSTHSISTSTAFS